MLDKTSSIICAFGLAAAAPSSPYRHLELCGIALTKDVYIVDYLPRTVPQNSGGQYFDVEYYLLNSPRYTALKDKFSSVIFKLMCYYRVCIPWDGDWVDQPNPELIDHIIAEIMDCHSGTLTCLFPDELALLVFDWDCLNLSIYHPSAEMQQLLAPIAASEGLFFRAAET